MTVPVQALGLRERKKASARRTLIRVSQEMFERRGFRATTLEEIAAGAEVTVRTLLRYFPSKEDLALALVQQAFENLEIGLLNRGPDESALAAWSRFMTEVAAQWEADPDLLDYSLFLETDPALQEKALIDIDRYQTLLASQIAQEMGVDPTTDLLPWLVAGVAVHGMHRLHRMWARRPADVDFANEISALGQTAERAMTCLRPPTAKAAR